MNIPCNPWGLACAMVLMMAVYGDAVGQPAASSIGSLVKEFNSSDVHVRLKVLNKLGNYKGLEKQADEVLPLLIEALSDPDDRMVQMTVRTEALEVLFRLIFYRSSLLKYDGTELFSPSAYPELSTALILGVTDPNPRIREKAVTNLGLLEKPSQEGENRWLNRFVVESDARVRIAIVRVIDWAAYSSPETVQLLLKALSDEEPSVGGYAAKALVKNIQVPASLVLPELFKGLATENLFAKGSFLNAIEMYGVEAEGYLPQLEQMLTSEPNAMMKSILTSTITTIKSRRPRRLPDAVEWRKPDNEPDKGAAVIEGNEEE